MTTDAEIKKELDSLVNEVPHLIELCKKTEDILMFGTKYQHWYSRAMKIVELLGHDRLTEFCSYYLIDPKRKAFNLATYVVQDYVKGIGATVNYDNKPKWDIHNVVIIRIMNQSQILASLKHRIDSVLADVKGHLLAGIEDEELATAEHLLRINLRASGAIAGVVLEAHLQRAAKNHSITINKKNPTIADLNDLLKSAAVYDIPVWRKIQHLADLRNLCDHKKDREPTELEVKDLIVGVTAIVKNVF
ncbi:MAG: hypothetical protein ACYDCJ_04550 [Gammaproteobacteria bacterium]